MSIPAITSSDTSSTQTTNSLQSLGEDDFLKLFVTQLQYQDPLSPMDSTGFTSQLAQFSSLEQLTNINTAIGNLASSQALTQNALAAGLIGKNVLVAGNQISLAGTANISFALPTATAQTNLSIYNASGQCVRQVSLGAENSGSITYTWDGKDSQGNTLPDGNYTYSVAAADATGAAVSATTSTYGMVTGVTLQNNLTYLVLDSGLQVQLSSIQEISD